MQAAAHDAGRAGAEQPSCSGPAQALGQRVRDFGLAVQSALDDSTARSILFRAVRSGAHRRRGLRAVRVELHAGPAGPRCWTAGNGNAAERGARRAGGPLLPALSDRPVRQCLAALTDNDDADTTATADTFLERY